MSVDHIEPQFPTLRRVLPDNTPPEAIQFIEQHVDWRRTGTPVVLAGQGPPAEGGITCLVRPERLNDLRRINKFLESVNRSLAPGGYFIGWLEPAHLRKRRLLKRLPAPFNSWCYFFDYLIRRVWPKLPFFRRSYFFLTGGRGRVMSEMETYGRLYSCGFSLRDSFECEGGLYVVAEKVGEPDYNTEATYGPLITLWRVGRHGELIKIFKLRTMTPFAEYAQQFIYERNGLGEGAKFKDDPRITRLGHFLRRYWLDELPMLYNLLRGDVKLFGVRPISRQYFNLFPQEFQVYRKKFKPGLIPPVYVEIPNCLEDTVAIERRYLQAYETRPLYTDLCYLGRALFNIVIKRVRSN